MNTIKSKGSKIEPVIISSVIIYMNNNEMICMQWFQSGPKCGRRCHMKSTYKRQPPLYKRVTKNGSIKNAE